MKTGIKIKAPLPISLKSVGLPNIELHMEEEYVEVVITPKKQEVSGIQIQCSSASPKKKKALKKEMEKAFQKTNFTMNMMWSTITESPFQKELRIIDHILLHVKDFYERKGQRFLYERKSKTAYDPLFLNGKFTYNRNGQTGSFPFPSGWSFLIVKGPLDYKNIPVSDQQAVILSEALYKNNPFLLQEMQSPLKLSLLWGEAAPNALTAWPLPALNTALVIFEQSYKRESFQKNLQKPYTCTPTQLDTMGVHIV